MTSKIITDISEIGLTTRLVLAKMGEQGLEQKVAETKVLPDEAFDRIRRTGRKEDNPDVYTGGNMLEFSSEDGKTRLYVILLRQAPFRTLFPAYFHELGHVANMEPIRKFGLPAYHMHVYAETLAFAFDGYAREKYNEIEKDYFPEVRDRKMITSCLKFTSECDGLDDVHRIAYMMLHKTFSIATKEYPNGLFQTYDEVYKAIRNVPPINVVTNGAMPN